MTNERMINEHGEDKLHVCPFSRIRHIDNWIRPLIHNPKTLLGPHLSSGMTVLDVGCGGGFITMAAARLIGENGRVIAADLQVEMLEAVARRASKEGLTSRVHILRCTKDHIGVTDQLDLAVALFMLHEVSDQRSFFKEIWDQLKPGGRLFVAEPIFHVSRRTFEGEVALAESLGFAVKKRPRILGGRAVVLEKHPSRT